MPELMQVLESIRAEEASIAKLFNADSGDTRVGSRGRRQSPQYMRQLAEAARLVADVRAGRVGMHYLAEAMTTSDFPQLFGDIIDRQMLARYRETPQSFRDWVHISQARDFRTVKRLTLEGGEGRLQRVGVVPEATEYPYEAFSDGEYTYQLAKYGKKYRLTWEDFINDDLEAFNSIPDRMGRSARRTEEYFATDLLFDANGPDATHFSSGNANIITSNPALSITALQTAFQVLSAQRDSDGEPIALDMVTLVVPPALEVPAQNILNATVTRVSAGAQGGATGVELETANWMKARVKLAIAPYIKDIVTSTTTTVRGNTSWALVADPNNGRPTAEVAFLRGHVDPELFIKSSNAQRVGGGGLSDPMDGDFETDAVEYKVRHVIGGALMDPKMAVASNGTGS